MVGHYFGWKGVGGCEFGWVCCLIMPDGIDLEVIFDKFIINSGEMKHFFLLVAIVQCLLILLLYFVCTMVQSPVI